MAEEKKKEWMLGLAGHSSVVALDDLVLLVKGGQLRPTDLVKKAGQPWRAAGEVPELAVHFAAPARSKESNPSKSPTVVPAPKAPPVRAARMAGKSDPASELTEEMEAVKPPSAPTGASSSAKPAEDKPLSAPAGEAEHEPPPRPLPAEAASTPGPMPGKDCSPLDLLGFGSHAFEPKKLLVAAAGLIPIAVVLLLGRWLGELEDTAGHRALFLAAHAAAVFGLAFVLVTLAYITRRQLEDKEYDVAGVLGYLKSHVATGLLYPGILLPSLFSLGVLWLLGLARNSGTGAATTLRVAYFIPMLFSFIAVLGAILYQLGSMYIPAAAALEGARFSGAVNAAWNTVRRQWGRMVLHWLIVTVACGVIGYVTVQLAMGAFLLPEFVFPEADPEVRKVWDYRMQGLMPIYKGVALGLGLTLPVSLFSTLGTLSYMALRHPAPAAPSVPELSEDTDKHPAVQS